MAVIQRFCSQKQNVSVSCFVWYPGSTDCICYATVGINDPVTSALHIIVGDSQPMDVCSVHHNNTFLRYSVSLLGYGFYGDVLADSVRKRWMGPARYDFFPQLTHWEHQETRPGVELGASYASTTGSCIQRIPQRNARLLQMSQTVVAQYLCMNTQMTSTPHAMGLY
ncbi:hypothetical protein J4Q44_G00292770 [Coregonus suidteri]|uniref:Uncharacterized protein n=1 Tax=Coregonus suidteri TaxID=861788 RepID=A0AAN8KU80_9TELE